MNDNTADQPNPITIKVTDGPTKAYFVRFNRDSLSLIDIHEYKQIYTPAVGTMSQRTRIIVDLAKSRIGMPLEATATGEAK